VGQRFAIAALSDASVVPRIVDSLGMNITDIGVIGAYRHWPRNFGTEGLNPDSLDELFFLDENPLRCTGSAIRGLLSSRSLEGADSLKTALQRWMLPAHVDQLISAVAAGDLLIWVPIAAPELECAVCLNLLRNSRNAVQIHDFEESGDKPGSI
jgi:hypothetical protein